MTTKLTQPLKWHGGKHYLAKRLISLMPSHIHYVEPYFGGGAVLLEKDPEGVSEVVNDIYLQLIDFWRILQSRELFVELQRLLAAAPFAEMEYGRAANLDKCLEWGTTNTAVLNKEYGGRMLSAAAFFIQCRQSRAGQFKEFATLSKTRTRRGMNEQASAWLNAIEGLPAVHARLKRVVILSRDALDVIRQQDGPETLFYLDPPYLHETRASTNVYEHEMTRGQHRFLCELLARIKGRFLLSGYRNEMYDTFAHEYGWHRTDFDLPNNAAGGAEKRRMTECVWMNFMPAKS